ncbi:hypothetical protein E2C01_082343 [Portunus trituberculatus]|uniref:Uncharacterized protein n=1 Tax=Portunus trituberculatus TaxID=210409 RepID=A0A5B7IPP3_PORTR|nr:hypothetical protein [Portunus trituberculatus]
MISTEQRCKIVAWQEVFRSPVEDQHRFRAEYGINYVPSLPTIYAIHAKFLQTGFVNDQPRSGRPRTGRTEENVAAVEVAFVQSQGKSIRRAGLELNISWASIQRMLKKDIRMYPYKIQVVQNLEPQDYDSRKEMCETLLHHYETDQPSWSGCGSAMRRCSTFLGASIGTTFESGGQKILLRFENIREIPPSWMFAVPCPLWESLDPTFSRRKMETPPM